MKRASGFIDEHNIMPMSHAERQACYYMFSEPAVICQNMFLATEATDISGRYCVTALTSAKE